MRRSELTIDLGALRRNVRRLREAAAPAELWAVVKADAYGHGAQDAARAALEAGAAALCVATVQEGAALRRAYPDARLVVLGPLAPGEERLARDARLEVTVSTPALPDGLDVHVKVDTGMGRWGMSPAELADVPPGPVVGLMSHLATADEPDPAPALAQLERFAAVADRFPGVRAAPREQRRHAALPGRPLRRRALRDRPLRPLARSGTTPPGTGSSRCSPGGATWRW